MLSQFAFYCILAKMQNRVIFVRLTQNPTLAIFDDAKPFMYISLCSIVIFDVFIAVALCYYLFRHRSGLIKTRPVIDTLIVYIISSSALTTTCASLFLIMYAAMPQNLIFFAFQLVLPELYINALLALLNSRKRLREESAMNTHAVTTAIPLTTIIVPERPFSLMPSYFWARSEKPKSTIHEESVIDITHLSPR